MIHMYNFTDNVQNVFDFSLIRSLVSRPDFRCVVLPCFCSFFFNLLNYIFPVLFLDFIHP